MSDIANSYDKNFLSTLDDNYKKYSTPKQRRLDTTNAFDKEIHRVDFDSSNQDKVDGGVNPYLNQFVDLQATDPYAEIRAENQSGLEQIGLGLVRATTKAVTEVLKLPGVVGGLIAAPMASENEGMDTVFNNWWIKALDNLNNKTNTDFLPVYTAKAVQDGNLWANIKSTSFWATDGADGLGFIVAMMAPGAIFEGIGLGSKLIESGAKAARVAGMVEKTEQAVNTLKSLGITAKNIDSASAILGNTIFEAGSEATGVGNNIDRKVEQVTMQRLKLLDAKRRLGEITVDQYNEMSAQVAEQTKAEYANQRALAMKNTFMSNVAILLGPNAIMHKAIWGKAAQKFEKASGVGLKGVAKRGGNILKHWGKAGISEGLWEEGSQTTIENMYVDKALRKELGQGNDFNIGDFTKEYINTLNTTEGQKTIFLGGVFAGPTMSYQGRKQDVKNRKETNEILSKIDGEIINFNTIFDNDIYEVNKDGSFVYEKDENGDDTSNRKLDGAAVMKVARALNYTEQESELFDLAVKTGNTQVVETLKQKAVFNMIMPAIHNGEGGLKALEQKLNSDSKFQELTEADKNSDSKNNTKSFVIDTLETAKYLQQQNEKFKEFSKDVIELKDERADEKTKNNFLNNLNTSYLYAKHNIRQNEKQLKNLEEKKNNLLEELNINPALSTEEVLSNGRLIGDYKSKSPLLTKVLDDINENIENTKKLKKDIADIWEGKDVDEAFKDYIDRYEEDQQKLSKEKEYNDIIDTVNNAKELKDLENVDSEDPVLKDIINRKKTILQVQEDNKNKDTKNNSGDAKNKKNVEISNQFDYISDQFEEGDDIRLGEDNNHFGLPSDKIKGKNFKVSKINKDTKNITITDESGKSNFTISFESLVKNLEHNPEESYSTEGGLNQQNTQESENIPSTKDIVHDSVDVKVISIDPATDERYPWVSEAAEEYERLPQNKEGKIIEFEINELNNSENSNFKPEWNEALEMIKNRDFSNPEFLIKHLPLNVIFNNGGTASLETHNENFEDKFNRTSRNLREAIVMELINGTPIKSITTTIAGQNNGQLQIEKEVLENSLLDLYEVSGNKDKINLENLYVVDDLGNLLNGKGQKWAANRKLSKGEIYLKIHTANGTPFPLKLNVQKVNNLQAEALYELYKYRFKDITSNTKSTLLINTPEEIQNIVKSNLSKELELFKSNGKSYDDVTVKDLVDLIIWDGTTSPKSQVRFYDKKLLVMNKTYSPEEFDDAKEEFINSLTNNKRQHIRFKDKKGGIKSLTIDNPNRLYLNYILQNNILNTNAKEILLHLKVILVFI